MISLVLEASTYDGSAALLDGSVVIEERSVAMRGRDAEALMPAVADLFARAGLQAAGVQRVICGAGPGSFTSLRIAASIAKGIAMSAGATLVPVSSLALLAASRHSASPGRLLAELDAMRGECYVQEFVVDASGVPAPAGNVRVIPLQLVDELALDTGATVIGPSRAGAAHVVPHARSASRITGMIDAAMPADLSAWEPSYGRLAAAQVSWEAVAGRPLQAG